MSEILPRQATRKEGQSEATAGHLVGLNLPLEEGVERAESGEASRGSS